MAAKEPSKPEPTYDFDDDANPENLFSCPICCEDKRYGLETVTNLVCEHIVCSDCLVKIIFNRLTIGAADVPCPYYHCSEAIHPNVIEKILSKTSRLSEIYQKNCISHAFIGSDVKETLVWCPKCVRPAVGPNFEKCPKIDCPYCLTDFCYFCSGRFHPGRSCNRMDAGLVADGNLRRCPRCASLVMKTGGCNSMACPRCRSHFCWICGKEIAGPLHFSGTNGCPYFDEMKRKTPQKILGMIAICIAGLILIIPACIGFALVVFAYLTFAIVMRFWSLDLVDSSVLSGWMNRIIRWALVPVVAIFALAISVLVACVTMVCSFFVLVGLFYFYLPITTFLNLQHLDEFFARRRLRNLARPVFGDNLAAVIAA